MAKNYDEYFLSRISEPDISRPLSGSTKFEALQAASDQKIAELKVLKQSQLVSEKAAAESYVGKLGLDPNGTAGYLTNLAGSFVSGTSRVMGDVGTIPSDAKALADEASLTETEIQAVNRYKQGTATEADVDLITTRKKLAAERDTPEAKARAPETLTPLQLFERATNERAKSREIDQVMDRSSVIHHGRRDAMQADLGEAFKTYGDKASQGWDNLWKGNVKDGSAQAVEGLAGLLFKAGEAAVNHPGAVGEYVVENLPQLLVGGVKKVGVELLAASNVGYATESYQKGMEKYQNENNGAWPPAEERRKMAMWAASTGLAEHYVDIKMLKGMSGSAKKAAADVGESVSTAGFKEALLSSAANVAKATGVGTVNETITEGFQTYAEGEASRTPASGADIYAGAVIGGLTGGVISGGGRTLSETARLAAVAGATKAEERANVERQSDVVNTAISSGDVSALLDPKGGNYAPDKAIAALFGNSQLETTTPEAKEANLALAENIVSGLEAQKTEKTKILQSISPDAVAAHLADLVDKQELLDKTDPAEPAHAILTQIVAGLQETIDAAPEDARRVEAEIAGIDRHLVEANKNMGALSDLVRPKVDVVADLAVVNAPVSEAAIQDAPERVKAVDRIITLSMAAPEQISEQQVQQLLNSTSVTLTEPQRTYLRSFSEARAAENALKGVSDVSDEILVGTNKPNGNVGIAQYRSRLADAVRVGNKDRAQTQVKNLALFAEDHNNKADAAVMALEKFQSTGETIEVLSDGERGWVFTPAGTPFLSEAARRKNGGFLVHKGTPESFIQTISTEADTLGKAAVELQAAFDLRFPTKAAKPAAAPTPVTAGTPTTTEAGAVNVTDVSQQGSGTQGQPQAGPVQTDGQAAANVATEVRGTEGTAELQPGVVEAAGVKSTQSAEKTESTVGDSVSSVDAKSTGETAVSESTQNSDSNTEGNSTSEAEQATESGKITALSDKSPEGTSFKARKLLGDFFTQSDGKESDANKRPLVAAKNFLSGLSVNTAREYLGVAEFDVEGKQLNALKTFKKTASVWADKVQANLARKKTKDGKASTDFFYTDMTQFLLQDLEDGTVALDENVQTAMVYAGYSWVNEQAGRSPFNTDEEINAILDRAEDHPVTTAERYHLSKVGARQNLVVNALGQRAVQALGLRVANNAPKDLMPKLESHLGAHIFKMLMDLGVLERTNVPGAVMKQLTGSTKTKENVDFQFIKLAQDGVGAQQIKEISEASRGTQGVLDKLFGVESGLKEPSLAPIPFTQKKTKNTNQTVPAKLAKIIERENAVASYVREDMWQLVGQLDKEIFLEIAGAEHLEGKHAANIPSLEATNDGLIREFDRFKEFVSGMKDTTAAVYFEHTVWKQQRVGIATNVINPQTSKIHRHMLFRKAWETTVDTNNEEQAKNFLLRVGEGLGIKTDKKSNDTNLPLVLAKAVSPEIESAVNALIEMLEGKDMTAEKQRALLAGVKAGGEKMHSLDALMALAQYKFASKNGKTEFTTQLMGEVDGVTNGPMLSHLLMGAANSVKDLFGLLNRGGFFEVGGAHTQYNVWRESLGNFDLYETTALHMTQAVHGVIAGAKNRNLDSVLNAIYSFTGELADKDGKVSKAGRNIIKTPLTAMVFGSSVGSAVESMANKFVESIYAGIEDVAAGEGDIDSLIENINLLLSQGRTYNISTHSTISELMDNQFTPDQVTGLKKAFKDTLGKAVKLTMEKDFAAFISQRQQFNWTAQVTFELYNAAYTGLREKLIADLMASGEMAYKEVYPKDDNGKAMKHLPKIKEPIHDITPKQEAELRKQLTDLAPVMHTQMSKDSGSLESGLRISKTARKLSTRSVYEGEIKFGTKFGDTGAVSTGTNSFEGSETAPGVAMAPMSVHSTDSYIMHTSLGESEALNVHDAKGVGVGGGQQAAQSLNEATWKTMLSYSPATEIADALSRTVQGLAALIKKGDLPPVVMDTLTTSMKAFAAKNEMDVETILTTMLSGAKAMAFSADDMKLQALSTMAAVDQYAFEGGNYLVTESDRAEAAAKREALVKGVSKEDMEAVKQIEAALNKVLEGNKEPAPVVEPDIEDDAVVKPPANSNFGTVGKPIKASNQELVDFLTKNPKASAKFVLQFLYGQLHGNPDAPNRDFNMKLIKALSKSVNPDLTINMVTKETLAADVLSLPEKPSLGWYSHNNAEEAIYITGPDFVHSAVRVEVLLHELVHAATAYALTTTAGAPYRAELEQLLKDAKAFVKEQGITTFDAALVNVDELVAYGITNKNFQTQVLAKMQVKPSTTMGKISNALQSFVNTLARLLGFTDADSANGLGVLLTNVAALIEQNAADQKENAAIRENLGNKTLSMAATVSALNNYSTLDLHQALDDGSLTPAFDEHLHGLLSGIVHKLHGPFGSFKADLMEDQALTPMDVFQKALATGVAPFASKSLAAGFLVTPQVSFALEQVEATVRAALSDKEILVTPVYRELSALYEEVYKKLTVADFHNALGGSLANATALHEFVFKMESTSADGRSEHLARFAALGLAHPEFHAMLNVATEFGDRTTGTKKTFAERLQKLFEKVLEFFQRKETRAYRGQNADARLQALVGVLVDIEAKKRNLLARQAAKKASPIDSMEAGLKKVVEKSIGKVEDIMGSQYVRNHASGLVQGLGGIARTVAGNRVDKFLEVTLAFRDRQTKGELGIIAGALANIVGPLEKFKFLLLASKNNERNRKADIAHTAKFVRESFANNGNDLKEADSKAITSVFMRTGAHNLLGTMTLAQIEGVLADTAALDKEIANYESQLSGPVKDEYILRANALGYYKATGKVAIGDFMMNAHNIARMYLSSSQRQITEVQAQQAEPILAALASLYAIRYTDHNVQEKAKAVLTKELARADGNGVDFLLKVHKKLEADSLEHLFKGNPTLMEHGYTPEITNPYVQVTTANLVDGAKLELAGYVKGARVGVDPADPDRDVKHMYVLSDGGLQPHLTGIMTIGSDTAKGSKKHSGYTNIRTASGLANANIQNSINAHRAAASAGAASASGGRMRPNRDLSQNNINYMAPLLDEMGGLVNWRYMMASDTKDNTLRRENRFDKVMGTLSGSITSKQTMKEQNKLAVAAMLEQYNSEFATRSASYSEVGPKSADPAMRQKWALLPQETKDAVRDIWGSDKMMVRNDLMDIIFGYRKLSAATMFHEANAERESRAARGLPTGVMSLDSISAMEKLTVAVIEGLVEISAVLSGKSRKDAQDYAKRTAHLVTKGEHIWQAVVSETKDILVVKTGMTMVGNIWSNFSMLYLHGVPWKAMFETTLVALKGATKHRLDTEELAKLQAQVATGYTQGNLAEIQRRITWLEDSIARNPVTKLIDEGLMPTIVEDLNEDDDIYSYKNALVRKTEKYTSKLPSGIVKVGKIVYMAHDTKMYQGLSRITQLSDFVARYSLYQHLTTKKDPMDSKAAIMRASDAFVNYDIPMHRGIQYMDDMGFMMFTKYFMGIQKELFKVAKEHPLRVYSTLLLGNFLDLGPIVLEGSMIGKFGNNPWRNGALLFPSSLSELATVNSAMALIK